MPVSGVAEYPVVDAETQVSTPADDAATCEDRQEALWNVGAAANHELQYLRIVGHVGRVDACHEGSPSARPHIRAAARRVVLSTTKQYHGCRGLQPFYVNYRK